MVHCTHCLLSSFQPHLKDYLWVLNGSEPGKCVSYGRIQGEWLVWFKDPAHKFVHILRSPAWWTARHRNLYWTKRYVCTCVSRLNIECFGSVQRGQHIEAKDFLSRNFVTHKLSRGRTFFTLREYSYPPTLQAGVRPLSGMLTAMLGAPSAPLAGTIYNGSESRSFLFLHKQQQR